MGLMSMSTVLVVVGVVLILCGVLAIAVGWSARGNRGFGRLRGESPETRRAVWRAIRDGETDDARVDRLARQVIRATPRVRWAKAFFGMMVALSIVQLVVGPHTTGEIILHLAQAGIWASLTAVSIVNQRRYDSYRGLIDNSVGGRRGAGSDD
jgi:hypothetical protein